MKLLFESWRQFLNEADFISGGMGEEGSPEKDALIQKFPELDEMDRREANQILETILNPQEKPMFLTSKRRMHSLSSEFLSLLEEKGLSIEEGPNPMWCGKNTFVYIGIPENVQRAIELGNNPLPKKEEYGYEEKFWIYMASGKSRLMCVTPEYHYQLGVLLGYGEENSRLFMEREKKRLKEEYVKWKKKWWKW